MTIEPLPRIGCLYTVYLVTSYLARRDRSIRFHTGYYGSNVHQSCLLAMLAENYSHLTGVRDTLALKRRKSDFMRDAKRAISHALASGKAMQFDADARRFAASPTSRQHASSGLELSLPSVTIFVVM